MAKDMMKYDECSPDETDEFWVAVHDLFMAAHAIGDCAADFGKDRTRRAKELATARRCVRHLASLALVRQDGCFRARLEKLLGD